LAQEKLKERVDEVMKFVGHYSICNLLETNKESISAFYHNLSYIKLKHIKYLRGWGENNLGSKVATLKHSLK
jgi:hypothetical protein